MIRVAVTTSRGDSLLIEQTKRIAHDLEIEYLPRLNKSLDSLRQQHQLDYLLVIERQQVVLKGQTTLVWHPNMAVPRIKALREGKNDPLIEVMGIKPGYKILDCTLGLAADALVASFAVGSKGSVTGLESSKYLAFMTQWGISNYTGSNKNLLAAMQRIRVINCNYNDYLPWQSDNSYDVVYFDPMFDYGLKRSSALNALRPLANYENLEPKTIKEALRVARFRVVMKKNAGSKKFSELGADHISGGKYSPISYGIWEK